MPQVTGDLQRRIRGIRNTKKITKAMELVAAAKMRRAVTAALATRPYALQARTLLSNLSLVTHEELHPLLEQRPLRQAAIIVFSSDRGLAGGLNSNLVRVAVDVLHETNASIECIVFGRKAQEALRRHQATLAAVFPMPSVHPTFRDILPAARIILQAFRNREYDRVDLVWTDYRSPLMQKALRRTILPITEASLEHTLAETAGLADAAAAHHQLPTTDYRFEPSPDVVLEALLPRMIEMQLYQAMLEATASEHAARMFAMHTASDAANDLIDDLTFTYNQARQAAITKDLAEISASRAALAG